MKDGGEKRRRRGGEESGSNDDGGGCCRSCCTVPNGEFVLVPTLTAVLACGFSAAALASCDWYRISKTDDCNTAVGANATRACETQTVGFGMIVTGDRNGDGDYNGQCAFYPSEEYWPTPSSSYEGADERIHLVALLASSVALLLGLVATLAAATGACVPYRKCGWATLGAAFFGTFLCQIASAAFFDSERCRRARFAYKGGGGCTVGSGFICCAIAAVLWILCAMFCSALPTVRIRQKPPKGKRRKKKSSSAAGEASLSSPASEAAAATSILVTETILADGSARTERRTNRTDGSIIVEISDGPCGGSGVGSDAESSSAPRPMVPDGGPSGAGGYNEERRRKKEERREKRLLSMSSFSTTVISEEARPESTITAGSSLLVAADREQEWWGEEPLRRMKEERREERRQRRSQRQNALEVEEAAAEKRRQVFAAEEETLLAAAEAELVVGADLVTSPADDGCLSSLSSSPASSPGASSSSSSLYSLEGEEKLLAEVLSPLLSPLMAEVLSPPPSPQWSLSDSALKSEELRLSPVSDSTLESDEPALSPASGSTLESEEPPLSPASGSTLDSNEPPLSPAATVEPEWTASASVGSGGRSVGFTKWADVREYFVGESAAAGAERSRNSSDGGDTPKWAIFGDECQRRSETSVAGEEKVAEDVAPTAGRSRRAVPSLERFRIPSEGGKTLSDEAAGGETKPDAYPPPDIKRTSGLKAKKKKHTPSSTGFSGPGRPPHDPGGILGHTSSDDEVGRDSFKVYESEGESTKDNVSQYEDNVVQFW